jgi:hypothetical protein
MVHYNIGRNADEKKKFAEQHRIFRELEHELSLDPQFVFYHFSSRDC